MTDSIPANLIARAKQGSRVDIGIIYTQYHQRIFRYLFYRTGDLQAAEDLTADVFLKMIQALPNYHQGLIPFQAWLFQVARNIAIDHYRRTAAHPAAEISDDLPDGDPSPDEQVDLHLTSENLSAALRQLDDLQKDVLLLRFIEELPIAETAAILHKSLDAVKALQYRGLKALRKSLTETPIE